MQQVQSGVFALNDFNFRTPKANLQVKSAIQHEHVMSKLEVYDYPGKYLEADQGQTYARVHIEELQTGHELLHGEGNARGLSVGSLFELSGHPRKDQNREYLIVSANHNIVSDVYRTGGGEEAPPDIYSCSFTAIPSKRPFRSARLTSKPVVKGPQTAIVVGPSGEEIYTDKYGRVKLQFHWDRYSKADENSSCWVRVAQAWAGAKWGAINIPRIGQEVIVDFIEGDPDRPMITGRVYNDDNMPPYDLPANDTQSGIKTRSSRGGGPTNINEFRFEDKKGEELIFLQAEKDQEVRVKHDLVELIGNEDHLTVKSDRFQAIEGDMNLEVKGDRNEKVDGTISREAGMDMQEKVGMKHALEAGLEIYLKAGLNVVIEAGMSITLKAGASFIVVGPTGVIISGVPTVLINSGGAPVPGFGMLAPATQRAAQTRRVLCGKEGDCAPSSQSAVATVSFVQVGGDCRRPFLQSLIAERQKLCLRTLERSKARFGRVRRTTRTLSSMRSWMPPGTAVFIPIYWNPAPKPCRCFAGTRPRELADVAPYLVPLQRGREPDPMASDLRMGKQLGHYGRVFGRV